MIVGTIPPTASLRLAATPPFAQGGLYMVAPTASHLPWHRGPYMVTHRMCRLLHRRGFLYCTETLLCRGEPNKVELRAAPAQGGAFFMRANKKAPKRSLFVFFMPDSVSSSRNDCTKRIRRRKAPNKIQWKKSE